MTQTVQVSTPEIRERFQEGVIATIFRLFFTPEMLNALLAGPATMDDYAATFASSGHRSVGSWVSVYESPEAAASALKVGIEEFTTVWQLRRLDDPGLGEKGAVLAGKPPQANGVPTIIYCWRSGPYLLEVVTHGSVDVDSTRSSPPPKVCRAAFLAHDPRQAPESRAVSPRRIARLSPE